MSIHQLHQQHFLITDKGTSSAIQKTHAQAQPKYEQLRKFYNNIRAFSVAFVSHNFYYIQYLNDKNEQIKKNKKNGYSLTAAA